MNIHTGDLRTELLFTRLQLKDAIYKVQYYETMVKRIEEVINTQEEIRTVITGMKKIIDEDKRI